MTLYPTSPLLVLYQICRAQEPVHPHHWRVRCRQDREHQEGHHLLRLRWILRSQEGRRLRRQEEGLARGPGSELMAVPLLFLYVPW